MKTKIEINFKKRLIVKITEFHYSTGIFFTGIKTYQVTFVDLISFNFVYEITMRTLNS